MPDKVKDVLNYKFPISFVGLVWIFTIVFGIWTVAGQTFATKNEVCNLKTQYEKSMTETGEDIKEIKESVQYLVRLHVRQ